MKMKKINKIVGLLGAFTLVSTALVGCGGADATELKYPDYPTANADTESWEQWEDYDPSQIKIDWYVDYSSFAWTGADAPWFQI